MESLMKIIITAVSVVAVTFLSLFLRFLYSKVLSFIQNDKGGEKDNESWFLFNLFRICAFNIANHNNFPEEMHSSNKKLIDELIKKFSIIDDSEYKIMKASSLNTFENAFGSFSREFLVLENMLDVMYQICKNIKDESNCKKTLTNFIKLLIMQSYISMRDEKIIGNLRVINEKDQKEYIAKKDELLKEISEEIDHFISVYYSKNDAETEVLILNLNNTIPDYDCRKYAHDYF